MPIRLRGALVTAGSIVAGAALYYFLFHTHTQTTESLRFKVYPFALPLVGFARADLRDALGMGYLEPLLGPRGVVEVGHCHPRQALVARPFDVANAPLIFRRNERVS